MKRNHKIKLIKLVIWIMAVVLFWGIRSSTLKTDKNTDKEPKQTESTLLDQTKVPENFYSIIGRADFQYLDQNSVNITETYGDLDSLGRPTYVYTKLTPKDYEVERGIPRKEIKVDPVGWIKPNPKVQLTLGDNSYKGYLYNRSHLLADSLGGEPIKENLITGTRLQNVGWNKAGQEGGMGYGETISRDWLSKHSEGYLLYEVWCHYNGDDLISDYQIVNILTSDGLIDQQIKVFNGTGSVSVEYLK